jgi:mycofactocin system glycosyltransferase
MRIQPGRASGGSADRAEPAAAPAPTTHAPPGIGADRLPAGFRVRLAPDTRVLADGDILVGGSPLTAMRLSPRARRYVATESGGKSVVVHDTASALLCERLLETNIGIPDLTPIAPADSQDLTVVVPVRDRAEQLDRALSGLEGLTCVVVDDASFRPERVAEVARAHGAQLLALRDNVGPAGARNRGLASVTTPFVAFVDSDVEVAGEDLLALTRHFADPHVALVGPRVAGTSRSLRPRWFERYDEFDSSLTLGRSPATVRPGAAVAWLPSACLVGRTLALEPGFDDELRVGEDVDLVWRLVGEGKQVRYDPTVEARHDSLATVTEWLGRKAFYGTGSALLGQRHGDAVAPAILMPTYAVAAALLLARRRAALPVAGVATLIGTRAVWRALPAVEGRTPVALKIAARGLGWAVRQETSLLLRHWWPAALIGACVSDRLRRAIVTALAIDAAMLLNEYRTEGVRPRPSGFLARRLDDMAYGAGLWWGSLRHRSIRALTPRRPARRSWRRMG